MNVSAKHQIVHDRGVGKEFNILKSAGDSLSGDTVRSFPHQILTIQGDFPMIRFIYSIDQIEDGGFAGSVGTDNGKDGILFHLKTDIVDGRQTPETDVEVFNSEMIHRVLIPWKQVKGKRHEAKGSNSTPSLCLMP
jgi:hypothetical protein